MQDHKVNLDLVLFDFMPLIQKNPNCMLIVTPRGGHLGWVAGKEAPLGAPWTDPVIMDFLEHLEQARSSNLTSSNPLDVNCFNNTRGLEHLEV